jgi:hypothetical protein
VRRNIFGNILNSNIHELVIEMFSRYFAKCLMYLKNVFIENVGKMEKWKEEK